jgi:V/A-type H+-transporting ATPase subunit A
MMTLGPGMLGGVFDGVQRPLTRLQAVSGDFIGRGLTVDALDAEKRWPFTATAEPGQRVRGGDVIGHVAETASFTHRIMVPPNVDGVVARIESGERTVHEPVAWLEDGREICMAHRWPAKTPRPVRRKLDCTEPFVTGQRVLDCLFPISAGGTAALPGGFGTGKTVLEQSLAKFSAADVIVYVGCGERGNEMADVLSEFPELEDPRTGGPLMDRTIMVVNTSNMPVAAREASVYAGVTIAEYFRDMGCVVAVMVDSTSRWSEALREISSRLEEMPGEEGYPTYLASRLASFYERAGRVECLGSEDQRIGSVTLVGAVSPPGGDFSEPVTQSTIRVTGAVWALDSSLAHRRHYPSVNWLRSHTLYFEGLRDWYVANVDPQWPHLRGQLMDILEKDAELQEVVQLVGPDALQDRDRLILEISRMMRDGFLQQNAMSDVDATCPMAKQLGMLRLMIEFYDASLAAVDDGVVLDRLLALPLREEISRLKEVPADTFDQTASELTAKMSEAFTRLRDKERPF